MANWTGMSSAVPTPLGRLGVSLRIWCGVECLRALFSSAYFSLFPTLQLSGSPFISIAHLWGSAWEQNFKQRNEVYHEAYNSLLCVPYNLSTNSNGQCLGLKGNGILILSMWQYQNNVLFLKNCLWKGRKINRKSHSLLMTIFKKCFSSMAIPTQKVSLKPSSFIL